MQCCALQGGEVGDHTGFEPPTGTLLCDPTVKGFQGWQPQAEQFPRIQEEEKDTRPSLILMQKSPFNLPVNILLAFSRGINHSNNRNKDDGSCALTRTARSPHHVLYTLSPTDIRNSLLGQDSYCCHCTEARTRAPNAQVTCPKSHSYEVWDLIFQSQISLRLDFKLQHFHPSLKH